MQDHGETVDTFLKRIHLICTDCKYNNKDEHILDTLIYGLDLRHVQSKLLELAKTSTLADSMKITQQYEATSKQLDDIQRCQSVIHALHTNQRYKLNNRRPEENARAAAEHGHPHAITGRAQSRAKRCPAHGTTCKEENQITGQRCVAHRREVTVLRKHTAPECMHFMWLMPVQVMRTQMPYIFIRCSIQPRKQVM